MDQFALLMTGLVLTLTACAIVAQLLRWRSVHRADRDAIGRAVHADPVWRKWLAHQGDDEERR
jgi:hypothetical protein